MRSISRPHPARTPLRRFLVALIALGVLVFAAPVAIAQDADPDSDPNADADSEIDAPAEPVARLTVTPDGDQSFDLLTGETTLPDGGTIQDTASGLTLHAAWIAFVEGETIDAREVTADTDTGRLTAATLHIDVPTLIATAEEGVTFTRDGLTVRAERARLHLGPGLVRFEAPSRESPELSGAALLLDADSGDAVLLGPYRFQDGPFLLSDDRDGA
ncbi:MAG: hypothetical protein WD336_04480, partial [Trueperaceae bacterium]